MMNLAEYRHCSTRLADFLPWSALVDEGIVLNKDGSFQRTAKFRGPDLDSAVPAELVAVAGRINNALRRLESGWAIFVEAQRHSASAYPPNTFPDVASALVDAERRAQFEEAGAHYESSYFLTLLYLPPDEGTAKAERLLYDISAPVLGLASLGQSFPTMFNMSRCDMWGSFKNPPAVSSAAAQHKLSCS
jgi:type IV secretion system protein TrbE